MTRVAAVTCLLGFSAWAADPPPEVDAGPLKDGVVILNIAGEGYVHGDIVQVSVDLKKVSTGSVVLYDWQKATGRPGWGPTYQIGTVETLPGMPAKPRAREAADAGQPLAPTPGPGEYLLKVDRGWVVCKASALGAIIVKKVGHDEEAGAAMRERRY